MYLLDTNVLSELIRKAPDRSVVAHLRDQRCTDVFASAISRYELRYGAERRPDAVTFWARLQRDLLPLATWLPVNQDISERGGAISAGLRAKGCPCGDMDPLLAATALEHGLVLVTRNLRHFRHIPRLKVENWFGDS